MELYQLRHFVAVAETGSFTRAAERCFVTQPALSGSIARLEDDLGTRLFLRTKRSVSLTEAGRRLLADSVPILKACNQLRADIQSAKEKKTLRLGLVRSFPTHKLAMLLVALKNDLAGLEVQITEGTIDELAERLQVGKIDVALTILTENASPSPTALPIYKERYVLYAASTHPLANRREIELAELIGQNFIARSACEVYSSTTNLFREKEIKTKVVCRTQQDERALELVRAGLGVALLPETFDVSDVKKIPVSDFEVYRTVGLQWGKVHDPELIKRLCIFAKTHPWHA